MRHACPIDDQLRERGLRTTADRHKMLELFSEDRTWSAAEISKRLRRTNLSTVYRNVQTLLAEKLIVETHAHDGDARYELSGRAHHDHLACETCDTLACVPCPAPSLSKHIIELVGTCRSCQPV